MNDITVSGKHDITIPIADDERPMRDLLAGILKRSGFQQFRFGADDHRAIGLMRHEGPLGLAFPDIPARGFTDIEALAPARHCSPSCGCRIGSAGSAVEKVMASLDGGTDRLVVKPSTSGKMTDVPSKHARGAQP